MWQMVEAQLKVTSTECNLSWNLLDTTEQQQIPKPLFRLKCFKKKIPYTMQLLRYREETDSFDINLYKDVLGALVYLNLI